MVFLEDDACFVYCANAVNWRQIVIYVHVYNYYQAIIVFVIFSHEKMSVNILKLKRVHLCALINNEKFCDL